MFAGAAVTDTATLTGGNASTATGTVTYTVYARVPSKWFPFWQWKPVASGGTVNVTGGVVPSSNPVTLPVGVYEWQASYSGDSSNDPSVSKFGTEAENVVPVPFCGYGWNWGLNSELQALAASSAQAPLPQAPVPAQALLTPKLEESSARVKLHDR